MTRPAEEHAPSTAEDERFLADLAERVVRYRMEVPALLFLESLPPLSFVGSQAMVFFAPLVQALFASPQYERVGRLLEDRDHLDRLARRIEAAAARRDGRAAAEPPGEETTPEA